MPPGPFRPGRKRWLTAGVGLVATALAGVLAAVGALDGAERGLWDARVRLLARPAPADMPLRLVVVDEASLSWAEERLGPEWQWPWPRSAWGLLTDLARRAGARALLFDLQLSTPHRFPSSDEDFAAALEAAAGELPVALGVLVGEEAGMSSRWPAEVRRPPWRLVGSREGEALAAHTAAFPLPALAQAAGALGHIAGDREVDGVVRTVHPLRLFDGVPLPMLGLAAWAASRGVEEMGLEVPSGGGALLLGDERIPLDGRGRARPRFPRPPVAGGYLYPAYSAAPLLEAELRHRQGASPEESDDALMEELRGRWVLVGVSAAALFDAFPTPVEPVTTGVEIHAAVLDSLLSRSFLRTLPAGWGLGEALVLALAAAAATLLGRRLGVLLAAWLLGLSLPFLVGLGAYAAGWQVPVALPAAAASVALVVGTLLSYITEGRHRRFLLRAFGHYLSPAVIRRLLDDPRRLELGGERRELTIFFSDLEAFSTISEDLDPQDLTRLLNDYLSEMTEVILEQEGTLDKYEGDAILAFWNAPLDQDDHALRACRAAVACRRRLEARQTDFAHQAGRPLRMRIGIHTGVVVVGNLGSKKRFDYTVLGDAANLASRLEGANKGFGTGLMVSQATWERLGGVLYGREIGDLVVVGRGKPVKVFEPLGIAGEAEPSWLATYRQALAAFHRGDRHEARRLFEEIPEDPVACRWARELGADGGRAEPWDGIFRLTAK